MTKADAIAFAQTIPGFYGVDELESLWDCLAETPEKSCVVEIGVWCGRSTSLILSMWEEKRFNIHLIDPFIALLEEGERSIRDFVTMASKHFDGVPFTLHKRTSDAVRDIPEYIRFVHVDGNHNAPSPQTDCEFYLPRMLVGDYAVFHDYHRPAGEYETFPAVSEAVNYELDRQMLENVRVVDSQIVTRRRHWRNGC